ncbi:MAG: RimK family alpha-L-glutamate ligase [Promethearchaeota archaeon]
MEKPKIGIITDKFHFEQRLPEFLKYLKSKADVSIYIEESYLLKNQNLNFNEDLFFVKGKSKLILALVRLIQDKTSIPVINSHKGIWLANHRFLNSLMLYKAGIRVPDFSLIPCNSPESYEDFIIKNIIDQKRYAFKPKIKKENGHLKIYDQRALNEVNGGQENYKYFYYQKFIKSKWEYKVYGLGEKFFFYKQIPFLINPNKMETRRKISEILELKEIAFKTMRLMDLKVSSIDFLKSKDGHFYLTDINSLPNFNYIENGPKIFADFLLEQVKN